MIVENKLMSENTVANVSVGEGLSLSELRGLVEGQVILPDDVEYDEARTVFYGGIDLRPAAIVRAASASDVSRVVVFARENGIELAIRSGGHSFAGHSVLEGGIVLDLRNMKALDIDTNNRTTWAQTGLTAGEFTVAVGKHKLAVGFGDTGSVGIGGITVGGGVGYLSRKYGLTVDDVLAAEIVTADGQILLVDAETHPDLFWAIRGGGGNFGVVTRFKYRLHEVDTVVGGILVLPATPDVIAGFMAAAEAAPDELSTIANVMAAPPMPFLPAEVHGQLVLFALMVCVGDVAESERTLAPFRALTEPIVDMLKPMSYPEIYPPEEMEYHPTAVAHTMFINRFDRSIAETILEYLQASDAPVRVAQLRVLGGAMARIPIEATAYAHRQERIMVNVAAFYEGVEDRIKRQAWVNEFAGALYQGNSAAYVNFLGEDGAARILDAYPEATLRRLQFVKAQYDPTNFFRLNHNILPADKN
jgi:FAD/FMN-containing dehydrogenase